MRRLSLVVIVFSLSLGAAALGQSLAVKTDGSLAWDLQTIALTLDASISVSYVADSATITAGWSLEDGAPSDLTFDAAITLGAIDVAASAVFDVQSPCLSAAALRATVALDGLVLDIAALRKGGGAGLTLSASPASGPLTSFAVGLNVDAFGRIQTESCALDFTYAEAQLAFSCGECVEVEATAAFSTDGFSELTLSASDVGGLPLGIQFGAQVRYTTDEKSVEVIPSFSLESPECADLYAGLVWDQATKTLEGISLYGVGLACEVGNVRVRGLWELDPMAISLVKAPYVGLVGFVWDTAGCCGEAGEASVAFFFGDDGLFELGEIEFAVEWPMVTGWMASLVVVIETAGGATLTIGWDAAF